VWFDEVLPLRKKLQERNDLSGVAVHRTLSTYSKPGPQTSGVPITRRTIL
jgi:hypothetical protein